MPIRTILVRNCLWLWVPPMGISFALWGSLGPDYQSDVFWRDIPPLLGIAENTFRFAVIAASVLFVFGLTTRRERSGLAIYLLGVALYAGSYVALILAPESAWAGSYLGFAAPALTPAIWIAGIGVAGSQIVVARAQWLSWIYFACAAGFLTAHIAHTTLVYARVS